MEMRVRPFEPKDAEELEQWRHSFTNSILNLPHGYVGPQAETVVVTDARDDSKIISLSGFAALIATPLIKNPNAKPLDILAALIRADAALTFTAAKMGMLSAYMTVPSEMTAYHRILRKYGYHDVNDGCVVFEKHLRAPVNPPLFEPPETAVAEGATPAVE